MNKRKILGYLIWLVAFIAPLQFSLLSTEDVSNAKGLISFVLLVALVFTGYVLVDGANTAGKAARTGNGH